MKTRYIPITIFFLLILITACGDKTNPTDIKVLYLHHSTGAVIWRSYSPSIITRIARKINPGLGEILSSKATLPRLIEEYNKQNDKNYFIEEKVFPKASPYGWKNFPYDYYNIWVKNSGTNNFMEEPTLEILAKDYQVIIFKHCYPVSNILPDDGKPDVDSEIKTIQNYTLQYLALRDKLHEFPETKFILFTGAAQVKNNIKEDEALRAKEFFSWVINEWDIDGDNIYLWDLYGLETEGGIYFKDEYAVSTNDSHPNTQFASKVVVLLFNRIIDIIKNEGTGTHLTGIKK